MKKQKNQFIKGQLVEVLKTPPNILHKGHGRHKPKIYRGVVYQVCEKHVTIDFGFYRESFYPEDVSYVKGSKQGGRQYEGQISS